MRVGLKTERILWLYQSSRLFGCYPAVILKSPQHFVIDKSISLLSIRMRIVFCFRLRFLNFIECNWIQFQTAAGIILNVTFVAICITTQRLNFNVNFKTIGKCRCLSEITKSVRLCSTLFKQCSLSRYRWWKTRFHDEGESLVVVVCPLIFQLWTTISIKDASISSLSFAG